MNSKSTADVDDASSTSSGALGNRRTTDVTFHGSDPDKVASGALCVDGTTRCQARTRVYRDGALVSEGFPVAEISDYLDADESAVVWLDLRNPDRQDLAVLSEEFGLHALAIEDPVAPHERPKLDRYRDYLFLTAYGARFEADTGELRTSEIAAFITRRALITVRKDDGLDIGAVVSRWDASTDLSKEGVGYLVHGLLDYIVDGHFEAVQSMDEQVESLEDQLFADIPQDMALQRGSFQLRKSLVLLRRVVLPMREMINALMRRDLRVVTDDLMPYYQDVYDHVLRATEWTESLRDMVASVMETNLSVQANRMNLIMKKVTSWAAIIAVPTAITGFYGQNLPYPGYATQWGVLFSTALIAALSALLYLVFKRKDWL